ncbi:MAG: ATP-dependent RecD-like DNA helicase [Bacilli bacterium]|nr:ATP-dependent RecD-like DNA helicase [Bacilli bacterium]
MDESLNFINRKINDLNEKIEKNIDDSVDNRGYMSQNIIKSLRDLVEYIAFKVYVIENKKCYVEYNHENNGLAIKYIKSLHKHEILKKFHALLEIGPSHNSYNEDGSIRLMVKYQEYLIDLKRHYFVIFREKILTNLYKFPIFKIDPSLYDYYKEIYDKLIQVKFDNNERVFGNTYYIKKNKPIAIDDRVFYELTLTPATDYINKFNRIIFYSPIRIPDNYAIKVGYVKKNIKSFKSEVEIKIINNYEIFIKPAEINSLYRIFGINKRVSYRANEYDYFMQLLKNNCWTLNNIINLNDEEFEIIRQESSVYNTHNLFELFEMIRNITINNKPGHNVLKYLIHMLRNSVVIDQICDKQCYILSNLYLQYGCNVFETMPYASALNGHKISISDLLEIIDPENREYEFFGRKIKDLCDSTNRIYFSFKELGYSEEEGKKLIKEFNKRVYYKHSERYLETIGNKVYIRGCEESTIKIIDILKNKTKEKYDDYKNMYDVFAIFNDYDFTDNIKKDISEKLYVNSKVGLIYGSAGTGKTEMIKIISKIFNGKKIAFLAKTNAALNNIKIRVGKEVIDDYDFYTVDKFIDNNVCYIYDLIIVDECSMVENSIMLQMLEKNNYDCLLLVGDIYQIEAIEFGNWFRFAKELIVDNSYELTENFRTTNNGLKNLWSKVRNLDAGITEKTIDEAYSEIISESIFENRKEEEIVLCLNYDGPYGINNINRYLQRTNKNDSVEWGINSYKVGDPIIFSDVRRFSNVLYNNLKGKILRIEKDENSITFELFVERNISNLDAFVNNIKVVSTDEYGSIIEIRVLKKDDDDKDDDVVYVVPFVVSYATSIHKSQGLEFDSVKIIICDESEELITKNIFYTAITRSKDHLKIYWSPECQDKVIKNMKDCNLKDDVIIIKSKL